jgi:hypothetical protein
VQNSLIRRISSSGLSRESDSIFEQKKVALAPCVEQIQAGKALGREALAPLVDEAIAAIEFALNIRPSVSVGQQQKQTCATSARTLRAATCC